MSKIEVVLTFDDSKGSVLGLFNLNKQILELLTGIIEYKEQRIFSFLDDSEEPEQISFQEILKTIREPLILNTFSQWFSAINAVLSHGNIEMIQELDSILEKMIQAVINEKENS